MADRQSKFGSAREELTRMDIASAIVTTFSLAVTAPLVDILRDNVEFFVARQAEPNDYILFVLGLAAVLPGIIVGLLLLVRTTAIRDGLSFALFAGLIGVLILQVVRSAPLTSNLPGTVQIGLSVISGLGAVVGLARWPLMRTYLRVGLVMPLILVSFFLFSEPVRAAMSGDPASDQTVGIAEPRPVVFLMFDELPLTSLIRTDGSLNEERFPNFARLSQHTTWFRNAFANSPSTTVSIPSILSGLYPREHAFSIAPVASNHPRNLFTLLDDEYSVVGGESVTKLCPEEVCEDSTPLATRWRSLPTDTWFLLLHMTLPDSMTDWLPPIDEAWAGFGQNVLSIEGDDSVSSESIEFDALIRDALSSDRMRSFNRFIEGIEASEPETLYFHHSLVTHRPWQYLPNGQTYGAHPRVPGTHQSTWTDQQFLVDQGYQRHVMQVGLADVMVGQLLDRLEQQSLIDDALIVVTADHGIAFWPGEPMRGAMEERLGSVGAVPLFVSFDEAWDGMEVDEPVELVDILPTIATSVGADVDWDFDGVPLQATVSGEGDASREIFTFPGPVSHDDAPHAREEATRELAARYELDGGWKHLLKPSLSLELVGESPRDVGLGSPLDWTVELDRLENLESVDLESDTLPVMIEGRIANGGGEGSRFRLALSLNDTISAVIETFDQARGDMISALVRSGDLRGGYNRLEVFLVEDLREGVRLRPIPHVQPTN